MEPKEENSDNEKEGGIETKDPKFRCRFYESEFPETNDVVIVKYREAQEHNAKVELLEYDNMEGMILASELTRKRTSTVNKHIRIGRKEPAVVLKVDKAKGIFFLIIYLRIS